jgi:hypothetical protein
MGEIAVVRGCPLQALPFCSEAPWKREFYGGFLHAYGHRRSFPTLVMKLGWVLRKRPEIRLETGVLAG